MLKKDTCKQRRALLKTLLAGSTAGALGSLGQLALMQQASAASPVFSDYKAMVCIFLYGGNDSFNMLVPTGADKLTGYPAYVEARGNLSVANVNLDFQEGRLAKGAGNPYYAEGRSAAAYLKGVYPLQANKGIELGVNAVMPELAQLIHQNKASLLANIGNLVAPVSRSQIIDESARLPLFLFAHNHQQRALQTGQGNNLNDVGWAGKIADSWTGINNGSPLGLNISYAGNDRMLIGKSTVPLVARAGSVPYVYDLRKDTYSSHTDRRALFQALTGNSNASGTGNVSFDEQSTLHASDPFQQLFSKASQTSLEVFDLLGESWEQHQLNYTSTDSYGNDLFSIPSASDLGLSDEINGQLIQQLEAVAKMIDMGAQDTFKSGGYNRQIFMVKLGGFDTHSDQLSKHPLLLRELSLALSKFQIAMEERGHANKVTTFTMSDFGRTLGNNGDGTDHAWGAHHLVMGGDGTTRSGSLNGGQMFGQLPDLRLEGADDYSHKGRIIPSTAQDQLNATLCRWFGVEDRLMPNLFPNLRHFEQVSGDARSAYLNDLFIG